MSGCPVVIDGEACTAGQRLVLGTCLYHYRQRKAGRALTAYSPRRARGAVVMRDEQGRKQCARCRVWKPTLGYTPSIRTTDKLQAWCSNCSSDYMMERRYGFTMEEVERRVAQQGGCAICGTLRPKHAGHRNGWHVDHDHACCAGEYTCGQCIRAILCADCNKLIGLAHDSVDRLRRAASYLTRHADLRNPRNLTRSPKTR